MDLGITWTPYFLTIFASLLSWGISKNGTNIIWTSQKVIYFSKVTRLWVKKWACHAHFKFELKLLINMSILLPKFFHLDINCLHIKWIKLFSQLSSKPNHLYAIWEKLIFFYQDRTQVVQICPFCTTWVLSWSNNIGFSQFNQKWLVLELSYNIYIFH